VQLPGRQNRILEDPATEVAPLVRTLAQAACAAAGVIVRPFPEGVRISIGEVEGNSIFLSVAEAFRKEL
ncbi:hypothetical protein ACFVZ3_40875, partial [Kitasatospora purpeofusca]